MQAVLQEALTSMSELKLLNTLAKPAGTEAEADNMLEYNCSWCATVVMQWLVLKCCQ